MANQIQRLPVIEWQPPVSRPTRTAVTRNHSDNQDFGFLVSMITVAAVCMSGLTIAAVSSLTTQPSTQTYTYRSYQ